MKMYRIMSVAVTILCAACLLSCSSDKVEINLNLEKGDSFRIRTTTEQLSKRTNSEQESTSTATITQDMGFEVTEVSSEGNMNVEVTFERIAFGMEDAGRNFSYDSDSLDEQVHPVLKGMLSIAGQSYSMVLSPDGEPLEIIGIDKVIDHMLSNVELADTNRREQLRNQWNEVYGAKNSREICATVVRDDSAATGRGGGTHGLTPPLLR